MTHWRRRLVLELTLPLALGVIATVWLVFSGIDVGLSRHAWQLAPDWGAGDVPPWSWLYHFGTVPSLMLGVGGLVWAVQAAIRRKPWRVAAFLAIVLALGPGLLVNGIFKAGWGRPRPRQLVEFGGNETYQPPWQPGKPGGGRRSFPSGHSSMGFFLMAPWFIARRRRSRAALLWLLGGLAGGAFMGTARILQGGHFITDVLWAGLFVYAIGWWVDVWLFGREIAPLPGGDVATQPGPTGAKLR